MTKSINQVEGLGVVRVQDIGSCHCSCALLDFLILFSKDPQGPSTPQLSTPHDDGGLEAVTTQPGWFLQGNTLS